MVKIMILLALLMQMGVIVAINYLATIPAQWLVVYLLLGMVFSANIITPSFEKTMTKKPDHMFAMVLAIAWIMGFLSMMIIAFTTPRHQRKKSRPAEAGRE